MAVLHQRLRDAWDIGRVGPRIRENIDTAIQAAGVLRDGDFLRLTRPPLVTVRTPTEACRRDVEHVHGQELTLALVNLVRDTGGITRDELTAEDRPPLRLDAPRPGHHRPAAWPDRPPARRRHPDRRRGQPHGRRLSAEAARGCQTERAGRWHP